MPGRLPSYEQLELFPELKEDEMAKMGKVISRSDKPGFFAAGGDGAMFGKGSAGPAASGVSGKASNALSSEKWPKGGSGKMFGKGSAGKKTPGVSGKQTQSG